MIAARRVPRVLIAQIFLLVTLSAAPAAAADTLCDPAHQNCRTPLLALIDAEKVSIDVAFWFMEDAKYVDRLIARRNAGVPVRVLVDLRANSGHPKNAELIDRLKMAGIPIRYCTTSGILHWKTMIFGGQHTVQFSGANYSPEAFLFGFKYSDYVDEAIFFTDDPEVVSSFKTKYDDLWTDDTKFKDYANVRRPLSRIHPLFTTIDPELNFPPAENYATRSVDLYNKEALLIDTIMYRITDRRHADAMIAAVKRGVIVRLITEPLQYRDKKRLWHSWNVDRMYMEGVQIRDRAHKGLNHQKSVLLYSQGTTVFGSSNWSSPSAASQIEHNYFTGKPWIFQWFVDQFERKWLNLTGIAETKPFTPLPPSAPSYVSPADGAVDQPTSGMVLKWNPGYWGHQADIYFGTSSNPPLLKRDHAVRPVTTASFTLPALQSRRTYYWRIVNKTMADKTASGSVRYFRTR